MKNKCYPSKMADISSHYGGSVLALKGKSSIVLFSDLRFGQGSITIANDFTKVFSITNKLFVGLPQFVPDAQALLKRIIKNHNLYVLHERRPMEPQELSNMISYMLYDKRFTPYFTSPIVVGIDKYNTPYISGLDQIGCLSEPEDFVCSGTAEKNIAGMCESLYENTLDGEELFVMAAQAFLNSLDRDALSGWGVQAFLIEKNMIKKRILKMRQD